MRLLIVGSLGGQLHTAAKIAIDRGAKVAQVDTINQATNHLRAGKGADLLMVDASLDIAALIAANESERITVPVVACGVNVKPDIAASAIRAGAKEFIPLPPEADLIAAVLEAVADDEQPMIARDPAMQKVIEFANQIAASDASVLITGESGSGKEVMARYVHTKSKRAAAPFISVNCAAIPENLLESELFGHEKGAFTGASARRDGKFVEAHGGTLFLDEVGELPLDAQVKLLRALQEGEVDPVGAKAPVKVDFRLISATNQNMIKLVEDGRFREDLYYRLNVFPVWVPPLRERMDDVSNLVDHFIRRFASEEGKKIDGIDDKALDMLQRYPWPGNVRQLENAVFRAVVLADQRVLGVNEFPQIATHVEGFEAVMPAAPAPKDEAPKIEGPAMIGGKADMPATVSLAGGNGREELGIPALDPSGNVRALEDIEADMIRLAIGRYRGHMTEIAKKLGIGRSTLYRKMREFGLEAHTT